MTLEFLQFVGLFISGGYSLWFANYLRNSFGKKVEPPNTDESIEHTLTRGYKLLETMGKDVLRLWHPPNADGSPCNCAYCEIRGDDYENEPELTADEANAKRLLNHGYRVTISHDHPVKACCNKGLPPAQPNLLWTCPQCGISWKCHETVTPNHLFWCQEFSRYREGQGPTKSLVNTQVKNLESQLEQLGEAYTNLAREVKDLREMRGLRSTGQHVNGEPTYRLAPGGNILTQKDDLIKAQNQVIKQLQAQAKMWRHAFDHPGGTFMETFGEGPVRYDCPHGIACDRRKLAIETPVKAVTK